MHQRTYRTKPALTKQVAKILAQKKKTLSIAESCTGGLLSHSLTNIPGSSKFFLLGLIPYHSRFKTSLLNIPKKILQLKGAVSEEVGRLMAKNIRKLTKASFGLSITGIAGPAGAIPAKPTGLVYIGVTSSKKSISRKFLFKGSRLSVKKQAAYAALALLLKQIK